MISMLLIDGDVAIGEWLPVTWVWMPQLRPGHRELYLTAQTELPDGQRVTGLTLSCDDPLLGPMVDGVRRDFPEAVVGRAGQRASFTYTLAFNFCDASHPAHWEMLDVPPLQS